MFQDVFQGGSSVEVFSPQGKEPFALWKVLSGTPKPKTKYDKEVKCSIYNPEGNAGARIQIPRDGKTLGLVQRYLVLQVFIPVGAEFSMDISVNDHKDGKRRLRLSTAFRATSANDLHCQLPLGMIKRSVWLNLCLDLYSLVSDTWREATYKNLDAINMSLSSVCKLRRIFTMKRQLIDTTGELPESSDGANQIEYDSIPKSCLLNSDVKNEIQVINVPRIKQHEGGGQIPDVASSVSGRHSLSIESDLNSSGGKSSEYHIAFGSKVSGSSRTEPRKGSGKDGSTSSRQHRSSHSRTRSDGGGDGSVSTRTARPPTKDRLSVPGPVESAKAQSQRERKNSDPGTNTEDPEITVDKDSLRTSHTWTDGADNKEEIPFVKPHPPRQPSSEKRRKPRVKSAGKERSAGRERTKHSVQKEDGPSPQSSHHSSHTQPDRRKPQVANDDEVADILKEMQLSTQQEMNRSESESEPGSNNSSVIARDANDSITEVITTLNSKDDIGTYEDSEEEDTVDDVIYTYSSQPKLLKSQNRKNKKAQATSRKGHQSYKRNSGSESRLENDFVRSTSTDEEETLRHERRAPVEPVYIKTSPQHSNPTPAKQNGLLTVPPIGSPKTSQSRISVSKSSLREIPKEEIRKSGGAKPYEAHKYQMADFSDSCEAQMLMNLKKEAMEDGLESEEDDPDKNRPKGLSRSKVDYGDDNLSDSSDDTATSTLKGNHTYRSHNYQDEMGVLSQEFLTQSNPRDWGNVFSPPIVLPGNIGNQPAPAQAIDPNSISPGGPSKAHYDSKPQDHIDGEEDKLELLFDPVLNVYFDPKSKIYYELKP